jgi:LuxR family transcriptional regulator of csgAB operon
MMARILEQETGAACFCMEDIRSVPPSGDKKPRQQKLVLWDFMGKDLNSLLVTLDSYADEVFPEALLALFNVIPGRGIEENAAKHGVRGFFYENDQLDRFLRGVTAIFNGELWLSREIMTRFVLDQDIFSPKVKKILTPREIEILSLVAVGTKNEEIGRKLFISANTVKTHIYNIFKKIDVTNRLQAALWAAKHL